ncbi:nitric oxide reductase transcriptional regulator NorR [Thaumasiovibrio sp. DFM-14]|uniref:nitric oxide reductase transcriptional regulator NorR n=1 Tax=Thaumasiovibrio sp. DFM-14 TaxID=3384792 RepID=UPI0039A070E0
MPDPRVEQVLLQIALDLTTNLPEGHHYQRLISAVNQVMPCDASALFIFDEDACLVPVAVSGLSSTVLGRRFTPSNHPRLAAILNSRQPVRFDTDSSLPDPFDGLVMNTPEHAIDVHDCMGCSLYVNDELVGALTLDALDTGAFSRIDPLIIETFAALAAATIRNVTMFEALKKANQQQQSVNQLLIQQARAKEGELVGISPQIKLLRRNINMVAQSNFAVLISGETGTGKELVAHAIHAQSSRSDKAMVYVNCAALPESIAESELFGHLKGAFTGATSNRAGKFELADGGTIFLDEVGELPLLLQAKLLRVIQQGEVQRVGSDKNSYVDVRIIAATNRDLPQEVEAGRFRADLYHRLNVFPIAVPALRQRVGDIAVLAGYLLEKLQGQFHVPHLHLHPRALAYLEQQAWPGNVRELEHTLMRAGLQAIQQGEAVIAVSHLGVLKPEDPAVSDENVDLPFRARVEQFQKQLIIDTLQDCNGVWAQAAKQLGVDRGNLYRLGKKLGINQ